jgi:hypothetical protein
MPNDEGSPNALMTKIPNVRCASSDFVILSTFDIRHFDPGCLKFVRHELNRHSHARSNAIQDYRRGEHVFPEI